MAELLHDCLALTAPRVPPYGSLARTLLATGELPPRKSPRCGTDESQPTPSLSSIYAHVRCPPAFPRTSDNLLAACLNRDCTPEFAIDLLYRLNERRQGKRHPHLSRHAPAFEAWSRQIRSWCTQSLLNHVRDYHIRSLVDTTLTYGTAAILAMSYPQLAQEFHRLSRERTTFQDEHGGYHTLQYGPHSRQYIHWYEGKNVDSSSRVLQRRLVVFLPGGGWGSGNAWMYRLLAAGIQNTGRPRWFPRHPHVITDVAILNIRTYPDGNMTDQMQDGLDALQRLEDWYRDESRYLFQGPIERRVLVTLAGQSSGAHTALLVLVERALRRNGSLKMNGSGAAWEIDSFVGLCGPYHVEQHFEFEASRGVEQLSPMQAAAGFTRENMRELSATARLAAWLVKEQEPAAALDLFSQRLLLLHGMEDTTVPFAETAVCARHLRSLGLGSNGTMEVGRIDEVYLPGVGHEDTIVQLMMGLGPTADAVLQWMTDHVICPSLSHDSFQDQYVPPCMVKHRVGSRL
jgi:hypothetical protein